MELLCNHLTSTATFSRMHSCISDERSVALLLFPASRMAAPLVFLVRVFAFLAGLTKSGYGEKKSVTSVMNVHCFSKYNSWSDLALFVSTKTCVSVDHPYCDFDKYEGNLSL